MSNSTDFLSNINSGKTPLDRFILVVAWSISTIRPLRFGVTPYNPTLGETHHVSKGNLNVLLEQVLRFACMHCLQVSHHPPVFSLHATDDKENIEMTWCHSPVSKFNGTLVETKLKLHNHGETYEMSSPNLVIRIFPIPGTDWVGNVNIWCQEIGLVAELNYIGQSFFGFRAAMLVNCLLSSCDPNPTKCCSTVTVRNTTNTKARVIYDAKEVISRLQTPIVQDPEFRTLGWGLTSNRCQISLNGSTFTTATVTTFLTVQSFVEELDSHKLVLSIMTQCGTTGDYAFD
ncbi:Oxysterol-binding protein-related protein 4B [Glycine soja]